MCRLMHRAAYESDAFAEAEAGVKLSISLGFWLMAVSA